MEIAPLLFDLGRSQPTSRQIADLVKAGGAEALTDATRRAGAARYQEIRCRSALNWVKGMPFSWTLNPYRGCTHGCHYCYARRYHTQFELGADACHHYLELDVEGLDLPRFERAWQRLVDRHDMLRAIVLESGEQQVLSSVLQFWRLH